MDIAIFGANGQTGRLLTGQALAAGHRVVAATRRPDDFPLSDPKLTVAAADVRDAAAVTEVVAGVDAVLSTLGVSFTREAVNTYSVGTANIVAAMQSAGVRRLAVVSSTGAYPTRRTEFPLVLRVFEPIITRTIGKTVYDDMRRMETDRARQRAWTGRSCGHQDCLICRHPPTTTPERLIRLVVSPRASIWPTTCWRWPMTRQRSAKPSLCRPPNTHPPCGR